MQNDKKQFTIYKIHDRLYTIQVSKLYFDVNDQQKKAVRLSLFQYDQSLTKEKNYVNLNVDHVSCYFTKNHETKHLDFINYLK